MEDKASDKADPGKVIPIRGDKAALAKAGAARARKNETSCPKVARPDPSRLAQLTRGSRPS